ncbi:MAG: hypothetical protein M1827_003169 [Pycnora praestabilis]|nr:MAG: hypothetical protein M1827_003169 [Pycnora praestabilis]
MTGATTELGSRRFTSNWKFEDGDFKLRADNERPRLNRGWERTPQSPFAPHPKGRKVWKRYKLRSRPGTDVKSTLQIDTGDLEKSPVSLKEPQEGRDTGRAVKRLCLDEGQEKPESQGIGKSILYAGTKWRDEVGTPKRKLARRRSKRISNAKASTELSNATVALAEAGTEDDAVSTDESQPIGLIQYSSPEINDFIKVIPLDGPIKGKAPSAYSDISPRNISCSPASEVSDGSGETEPLLEPIFGVASSESALDDEYIDEERADEESGGSDVPRTVEDTCNSMNSVGAVVSDKEANMDDQEQITGWEETSTEGEMSKKEDILEMVSTVSHEAPNKCFDSPTRSLPPLTEHHDGTMDLDNKAPLLVQDIQGEISKSYSSLEAEGNLSKQPTVVTAKLEDLPHTPPPQVNDLHGGNKTRIEILPSPKVQVAKQMEYGMSIRDLAKDDGSSSLLDESSEVQSHPLTVFSPSKCALEGSDNLPSPELTDICVAKTLPKEEVIKPKSTAICEDTDLLKAFLDRVKVKKAAKIAENSETIRQALASPRRSPRKILGDLNTNPSSPQKLSDVMDVLDTPPSKQKSTVTLSDLEHTSEGQDETTNFRRSTRARLPVPSKPALGVPSFIPVRRADGSEPVILQKSEAQELGTITRANTRRNKGHANKPSVTILGLAQMLEVDNARRERREGGKQVAWDEQLVYFRQLEEELKEENRPVEKRPKLKRLKGLGATNGTPAPRRMQDMEEGNGTPAPKRTGDRVKEMGTAAPKRRARVRA